MAEDVDKDAAEEEKEETGLDGADETADSGAAETADGAEAGEGEGASEEGASEEGAPERGTPDAGEESAEAGEAASGEEAQGGDEEDSVVDDDVWAAALKEAEAAGSGGDTAEGGATGGTDASAGDVAATDGAATDGAASAQAAVETRPADFAELRGNSSEALANMDMILDIPVTVSVELGRAEMIIKDILQLGQGSVVELEKLAGEPMEILVNGRLVARGEVVMVEEKFGVRLTDIISPTERVKRLA
jgi:flagellar motor switch protein FliN/FliY